MLKNDVKLIISTILIIILLYLVLNLFTMNKATHALVYYDNELIKTIDLNINKNYNVKGYNGEVLIEVKDNKIRVEKETSPLHICSIQGFVDKSNQVLVCLPNKIVIKIIGNDKKIDTIVK